MTSSPIFAWLRLLAGLATIGAGISRGGPMLPALAVMGTGFTLGGLGALIWKNRRPGYWVEGVSMCLLVVGAILLYRR